MGDISYQNKDVASKMVGEVLVGKSLAAFGLPHLHVAGIMPTNLPAVESNELRLDNLFLLSDGSVAIIDYESKYDKENFVKYLNYIARVMKRYANQHQLEDLRSIRMIVIYTADVEKADSVYDLGGVTITVEPAFLVHQDTEEIYKKLTEKIYVRKPLSEEDLMQLMILPLTLKGKASKQEMIIKIIRLTWEMAEPDQRVRTLAGILTFTDKIIDVDSRKQIEEEIEMTQIGRMIFDKGVEAGRSDGMRESASRMLAAGKYALEEIVNISGLSLDEVMELKAERK